MIELKGDDPLVVEAMLQFMYTIDYDSGGNDQEPMSPMLFNVRVYSIAGKYDVMALKQRAKEKFTVAASTCWDMDDFAHVISEIYTSTPPEDRGLRDIVVEVTHPHIDVLLKKDDFRRVLEETPFFTADVTQVLIQTKLDVKRYKCTVIFSSTVP